MEAKEVKKQETLDDFFASSEVKSQSTKDTIRMVVDVHKDTAEVLCSAIGLDLAERKTDRQIAVMLIRSALQTANGKVLPLLQAMSSEQRKQFTKDLRY